MNKHFIKPDFNKKKQKQLKFSITVSNHQNFRHYATIVIA